MSTLDQKGIDVTIWHIVGVLMITVWLFGSVAQATEQVTNHNLTYYFTLAEIIPADNVEGQTPCMYEMKGLGYLENGEAMIYSGWVTISTAKGKDLAQGYAIQTWLDGSTTLSKTNFVLTISPDGKVSLLEGKSEYIKGTGRFEGIRGAGSFAGKRILPSSEESRECTFYEGVTLYTLPLR